MTVNIRRFRRPFILPILAGLLACLILLPAAAALVAEPIGTVRRDITTEARILLSHYGLELGQIVVTEVEDLTVLGGKALGAVAVLGGNSGEILLRPKDAFRSVGHRTSVLLHELAHVKQAELIAARAPYPGPARQLIWLQLNAALSDTAPVGKHHEHLALEGLETSASCSAGQSTRGATPYLKGRCTLSQAAAAALVNEGTWPTQDLIAAKAKALKLEDAAAREVSRKLRAGGDCVVPAGGRGMARTC